MYSVIRCPNDRNAAPQAGLRVSVSKTLHRNAALIPRGFRGVPREFWTAWQRQKAGQVAPAGKDIVTPSAPSAGQRDRTEQRPLCVAAGT